VFVCVVCVKFQLNISMAMPSAVPKAHRIGSRPPARIGPGLCRHFPLFSAFPNCIFLSRCINPLLFLFFAVLRCSTPEVLATPTQKDGRSVSRRSSTNRPRPRAHSPPSTFLFSALAMSPCAVGEKLYWFA